MTKPSSIAIVGMACRFPQAPNLELYWSNLKRGVNAVSEIPSSRWDWQEIFGDPTEDASKTNSKWGGFIEDIDVFDPLFFRLSPQQVAFIDPQQRLALETAWHTIENAGYSAETLSGRPIGVYVGVSKNDYAELMRTHNVPISSYVSTGTVHSIIANRISYFLNLRGKSEVIDTACSSSLVALHNAIRDIRNGECEAALVGGVNALLSSTMYISHGQSGMLSSKGRCAAFDHQADGYVRAEGVGFIFLKPLEVALQNRDHIVAVIRGSAVNHGGRANSLTSPCVNAQFEVIRSAHKDAGVDASSITYIEVHGTGTPLGDPVEIEAMKKAFGSCNSKCGIASVKTNIGHLESASGMAGLIKIILSLNNKWLPPQLHFEKLNPHISFADSPFYLVTEGQTWESNEPRRAGINAFGMGGVNAHVVLEEAPNKKPKPEPKQTQIIPLSAKNQNALKRQVNQFIAYLKSHQVRLCDVAQTLQSGRQMMRYRLAILANSKGELLEQLDKFSKGLTEKLWVGQAKEVRETFVLNQQNQKLITQHWTEGAHVDWGNIAGGERIPLPGYPFEKRRCWFDIPNNKRFYQTKPDITNIPVTEEEQLTKHTTISPSYTISGSDYFAKDHVVDGKAILPAVAYLGIALELMGRDVNCIEDVYWLRPLDVSADVQLKMHWDNEETQSFSLSSNDIVYMKGRFSSSPILKSKTITSLDKMDVKGRCTTQINPTTLYQQFSNYGLSYGSGFQVIREAYVGKNEALCYLKNQLLNESHDPICWKPSLLDGLFQSLVAAQLFSNPYAQQQVPYHLEQVIFFKPVTDNCIAHIRLYTSSNYQLTLYDMDGQTLASFCGFSKRPLTHKTNPSRLQYYTTDWLIYPLKMHRQRVNGILVFARSEKDLKSLSLQTDGNSKLVQVQAGKKFSKASGGRYQVNPQDSKSWEQLFTFLTERNFVVDTVVFSSPTFNKSIESSNYEQAIHQGVLSLLAFSQTVIRMRTGSKMRLLYVYQVESSINSCLQNMAGGFFRTLIYENPNLQFFTLGLDKKAKTESSRIVAQEIAYHSHPPLSEIAYQQNTRRVRVVKPLDSLTKKNSPVLVKKGAYLISGGTGKLAHVFALHLANSCKAKVILLGRSPLNKQTQKLINTIQQAGGSGIYFEADISKQNDVSRVFDELDKQNLRLRGIIHAAGFIEDAFILKKQAASFLHVLQPKIFGLINLDNASRSHPLDFFLMTSSVASLMPNQGQCDYATGNSFMDAFACYRNEQQMQRNCHGKTIAINWPLWASGGIRVSDEEEKHLHDVFGMNPISDEQGKEIFSTVIALNPAPSQCIAIDGDEKSIEQSLGVLKQQSSSVEENLEIMLWNLVPAGNVEYSINATFDDLGFDSLALVRLATKLNHLLDLSLTPSVFFEYQTVHALATHLGKLGAKASTILQHHALIDQQLGKLSFQKILYNDEFFMCDHVVEGKYNVPGACFVEMGLQAFINTQSEAEAYLLSNNFWVRKLSSSGSPIDMRIRLKPKRDTYEYEVYNGADETIHAMGEVSFASAELMRKLSKNPIQVEQIKARTTHKLKTEQLYPQIIAEGLNIGNTFMPIVDIVLSQDEALSHLRLPESVWETEADYILHPTMLTGVLQTALLNNKPQGIDGTRFIPIAIDEIVITQALPKECYVYTRPHCQNQNNEEIRKFDAVVITLNGETIGHFNGISLCCISGVREAKQHKPIESRSSKQQSAMHHPEQAVSIEMVEAFLIGLSSKHIGLEQQEIESSAPFEDFGIDSIMVVDLNRVLENTFGKLSKTLFFEYRNFSQLAEYFLRDHQATIYQQLDISTSDASLPESDEVLRHQTLKQEQTSNQDMSTGLLIQQNSKPLRQSQQHSKPVSSSDSAINDDIAIIGVAGRYPQAEDLNSFWQLLLEGRDCIQKVPEQRFSYAHVPAKWGSFIDNVDCFDALFFKISPRQAEMLDPQERLFLEVVWETLENAGYNQSRLDLISKKVGVFVGALWQPYMELGAEQSLLGNELGLSGLLYNIPNRVSYFFDWTGPSLAIDTACSSSLTALHYACMSLRTGESDHAIAGGVNLSLSSGKYRFLNDNDFLSSDGRCRSFGEGGDGYVPGEGVGSVLLKRLQDAEHDGDRILAILRATTINHGGKTHGFTVPNPNQQAELIKDALNKANVHPRTVSYVEAHGTGTSLGDPIEITGLKQAFEEKTSDYQFCPIGSLKSNIGHLEAAAGIAGLTKILLQLEHKTLVPSIHANKINPNIDFEISPFKVQTEVSPWSVSKAEYNKSLPRIALLSSFGAGGSNAHAVIQEYILDEQTLTATNSESVLDQIFPLSANEPETLELMVKRLAIYLEGLAGSQQPRLGNIAYTLQCGRSVFKYRVAFVAKDYPNLVQQLHEFNASLQKVGVIDFEVIDDEVWHNSCQTWVAKYKALPLVRGWLAGMKVHWDKLHKEGLRKIISLPSYPFKRERYWLPNSSDSKQSLGRHPNVRKSLTQIENSIHPLLHRNVSTLDHCRFESNFEHNAFFVGGHKIAKKSLLPGAAQMGMVLAAADLALPNGVEVLEDVVFAAPLGANNLGRVKVQLDLVSHTVGAAFTIRDHKGKLCSSGHVTRHIDEANPRVDLASIQAADAKILSAETIYDQLQALGLHLGAGMRTLKQVKVLASGGVIADVELSPEGVVQKGLNPGLFDALFQLTGWLSLKKENQLLIPFELKRVEYYSDVPSHCFAYVSPCFNNNADRSMRHYDACLVDSVGKMIVRITNIAVRFIDPVENRVETADELSVESQTGHSADSSLIISTPSWIEKPLANTIQSSQVNILICGFGFDLFFESDSVNASQIEWLPIPSPEDMSLADASVFIFNHLSQTLRFALAKGEEQSFVFALPMQHEVLASVASGMLRSIAIEHPLLRVKLVRFSSATQDLQNQLLTELTDLSSIEVILDGSIRKVRHWARLDVEVKVNSCLKQTGVYWITGGLGELGQTLLRSIVELAPQTKIILSGRSEFSRKQQSFLDKLSANGAMLSYVQCNVASEYEVEKALSHIHRQQGQLNGIFHLAGICKDSFFVSKTEADIEQVFAAKVHGTINLDRITQNEALDFFLCFSSIAGVAGNMGQSDYAAANCFQDAYMVHRQMLVAQGKRNGQSTAIAWPLWREGGMQVMDLPRLENQMGIRPMPNELGLSVISKVLHVNASRVLVSYGKEELIQQKLNQDFVRPRRTARSTATEQNNFDNQLSIELREILAKLIKMPATSLSLDVAFRDYGVESIALTEFANALNHDLEINVTPTLFFDHLNLAEVCKHLLETYPEEIAKHYRDKPQLEDSQAHKPFDVTLSPIEYKECQRDKKTPMQAVISEDTKQAFSNTKLAIAIVGISGQFPGSADLDAFWRSLIAGDDLITEIPAERWDWREFSSNEEAGSTRWGGFIEGIENFDAQFFNISPREAALMDPQHRKLLEVVWNCLENAGTRPSDIAGSRTAVFVGVANHDHAERLSLNGTDVQGHTSTGNTFSVLANRISYLFDLHGASEPVDTACSSSLVALDRAIQTIQSGRCNAAIVGAVNALLTPTFFTSFSRAGMLAPDGRCKTFDESANGYVRSEGFGVIYLKPLADAEANGDHIYAVIRGSSVNHNGKVHSLTAPNASAQTRLMLEVYEMAGVDPRAVGYIEAHGTGTALGDPLEIEALKNVFSTLYQQNKLAPSVTAHCGLGSVKSNIGHLESAAGMAGLLKVVLALQHKTLPATLHLHQQNPYIDLKGTPFHFVTETTQWQSFESLPRCAGISSFGFGGVNAHVVIEEYFPDVTLRVRENSGLQCIVLSAKTETQLMQRVRQLVEVLPSIDGSDFQRLAFTLQLGREPMTHRVAFVADEPKTLVKKLATFESLAFTEGKATEVKILDGCYYNGGNGLTSLLGDDEIELLTERWIANEQLDRLAAAWVKGEEINWTKLYTSNPGRLPLPTYPFAVQHFPLPGLVGKSGKSVPKNKEVLSTTEIELPAETKHTDSSEMLVDVIGQYIAAVTEMPQAYIDPDTNITDFGLDSILIAELSNRLEPILGFREPAIFYSAQSIRETAQKIAAHRPDLSKTHFSARSTETNYAISEKTELKSETPKTHLGDVAIIGLSGCYPQAGDILQFAKVLAEGRDCIEPVPVTHQSDREKPRWGSFISEAMSFDFGHFNMSYRDALVAHPEERLLLQETWKCFESAGYDPLQWLDSYGANIGVYIGASFHEYPELVSERNQHNSNVLPYSSQIFTYANRLSYFFNLVGPSIALDSACSSSLYAIFDAYNAIRFGLCDMALAGGVNLSLHRSKYDFLEDLNFLAKDGRCRAFAEGGTGYVPGEGIGIVLLKQFNQAMQDGDNVLAIIKGGAAGNDGRTHGFTVPNPDTQRDIIRKALAVAEVSPESISFVECHGTGTSLGDPIELAALTEAFGENVSTPCPISSVKSNIGHLEAAAGIAQLTKVVLQLQSRQYFPNVMHHENLNPNINFDQIPFRVQTKLAPWLLSDSQTVRRAGISSFGAGGTNVHLILEEAPELPEPILDSGFKFLIPFSADSDEQLFEIVQNTYQFIRSSDKLNGKLSVRNIAATLQQGRSARRQRMVFICKDSMQGLLVHLQTYLQGQQSHGDHDTSTIVSGVVTESGQSELMGRGASDIELQTIAKNWVLGVVKSFQIDPKARRVYLPSYIFRQDLVNPSTGEASHGKEITSTSNNSKTDTSTLDLVRNTLKQLMGVLPKVYTDDKLFADLGIDSIMAARIHAELTKYYPEFDMFSLFEFNTAILLSSHLDGLARINHSASLSMEAPANGNSAGSLEEVGDIGKLEFGHKQIPVDSYINAYHQWGKVNRKIKIESVLVKQCRIEYLLCGQGPTIVLLPPFNSTGIIWIRQLQGLSDRNQIVVPHYPGLSNSDWHEGLDDFEVLAEYMTGFIDELAKNKLVASNKVHWVGWSLGGFLAQIINKHYPDYVDRLVLISTTTISWSSKEYTISGEEFSRKSAEEFQQNFDKLPAPLRKMPEMNALKKQGHIERFVLGTSNRRIIDGYFRMIARFRNIEAASHVRAKTLLISGADDELMPAKFARALSEKIPNASYREIPQGQHFLSLFQYKTINKLLQEWFACEQEFSKYVEDKVSSLK